MIFSNLETITVMNSQVLSDLEIRVQLQSKDSTQSVGDIFQHMGDYFKMYKVYCSNQEISLATIDSLRGENNSFKSFLQDCFEHPRCRQLSLTSFLIQPIQRICKYPLLFKELVNNTPASHPDYPKLVEVKKKIEEIVIDINEAKRRTEVQQRILSIQNNVEGAFDLVAPTRVLAREGPLLLKRFTSDKFTEHIVFLFNDMILLAKKKESRLLSSKKEFQLVAEVNLDVICVGMWVEDLSMKQFMISSSGTVLYILCSNNENDTLSWLLSIEKAIADIEQTRRSRKSTDLSLK